MIVTRSVEETRAVLRSLPRPLGLVPTMGALHQGHLSLVQAATSRWASVAASLFVNPTQFGANEDLDKYPRDETRDFGLFEEAGVAVVFAPPAGEMYAAGHSTVVQVGGPITAAFEAAMRPGHFDGVASIVAKLLNVTQPDAAFFGQKDAQQLAVIRRMVCDLNLPVEIVGVPTVREPDGLAMSSRNAYLTPDQRAAAPGLYVALLAGAQAAAKPGAGPRDVIAVVTTTLAPLETTLKSADDLPEGQPGQSSARGPGFTIDYIAVVNADTFVQEDDLGPRSLLISAVRLGATRLIDNILLASAYPAGDATS